jgi:hypothetical protein
MALETIERNLPPAIQHALSGRGCSCACHSAASQSLMLIVGLSLAGLGYFFGARS